MCLILFAYRQDPDFPLVLAANRDEFHGRPTIEASYWQAGSSTDTGRILAGKDKLAGGTWLGVSETGRFAAVTNIRNPAQVSDKPRSRGELPSEFLASSQSASQYCQDVASRGPDYAGFNLLVSDGSELAYVNNRDGEVLVLEPGIYGLSNSALDTDWPKVSTGKSRLRDLLNAGQPRTDQLLSLMADRTIAPDESLPSTGVPQALERTLSATFILDEGLNYGTRCSTAVIMGNNGEYRFSERNFDNKGAMTSHHHYESAIEAIRQSA